MTYIYDLMLNFNKELYEFYEWDLQDKIYHIKRINLIKIDSKSYNDLLNNKVILNDDLMLSIFNKCEYFSDKKIMQIPYCILVSDSYRVMAIMMDKNAQIIKYSSLLLDEEEDVLEVLNHLPKVKLEYKIIEEKVKNNLTRKENYIIKYIKKDLNNSYKNKDINKLKYLYYEFFGIENNNITEIYNSLINSLNDNINEKHYNLYNLIKLSLTRNV